MLHGLRIILFGVPGSGKGTQASLLSAKLSIPVISTGEILRQEITNKSSIGELANSFVKQGELVPDSIVIDIIKARLAQPDCINGYILDGFPRNQTQAHALDNANIKLDHVIYITVPKEDVIERLSGRRVHQSSGRVYHIKFNPPKIAGKDDFTGEELIQRSDDKPEVIRNRLALSDAQMSSLEQYYENHTATLSVVDGNRAAELVQKDILSILAS
jgi:adenylate kinase